VSHPQTRLGAKSKRALDKGDQPDKAASMEDAINQLAQEKFVASAAIDAAIALQQAKLPNRNPTGAQIRAKQKVTLDEIREEFLIRVAEGESVFTICHDEHMPARPTVYRWIRENSQFRDEYTAALDQRADKYVEMIANLSEHMQMRAAMGASNEEMTALKTHINSLQWIAAKLNPKKYGDKIQAEIDQKVTLDDNQLDLRLKALLDKAKPKKAE
jgi:hypothetical protein